MKWIYVRKTVLEDFENMKNELYNLKMSESLSKLPKKDVSHKEIIDTLGLKEIPEKSTKKLNIKPSKLTKLEEKY